MTTTAPETFEFQSEARQLLDLMVHSVYSHKEIFLRELISNASDALDKLRFEALTNTELAAFTEDAHIRISIDPADRTLSIEDNGIGMNRDELIRYLGTIARSGSREFLTALKDAKKGGLRPELIGQFGVGFYASFMVAGRVTVLTRRAGEAQAWRWESHGDGRYTIEEAERPAPGTTVTLHLKPADEEDGIEDYTKEWAIRDIVRRYSDFVAYPIRMKVERKETERDEAGKPKEGAVEQTVVRDETLNSMKAIWTRPESDVTEEEYKEFYKHVSHEWSEPLTRLLVKAEGTVEFRALLFIPSRAPFNLFMREADHGIQLYIKRVFIMSDCKALIPEYLRFLRGVVDSEDLSLNISRELLQNNRHIQVIRRRIVSKVIESLKKMMTDERENYLKFWKEFGTVMKEGLVHDERNRKELIEICLFDTTHGEGERATLAECIDRMKPGQDAIYYMTGESRAAIEQSPHLEALRERDYEVLLLTDPVDEIWTQSIREQNGKPLRSVGKGEVELGDEADKEKRETERKGKETGYKSLFDALRGALDDRVKEVRLSTRLTSSPACLVGDEYDLSPQMERLLRATGQEAPRVKRILELNAGHPIVEKLQALHAANAEESRLADYAELLYGQAVLAEGGQLPDPAGFSKKVAEMMARAM